MYLSSKQCETLVCRLNLASFTLVLVAGPATSATASPTYLRTYDRPSTILRGMPQLARLPLLSLLHAISRLGRPPFSLLARRTWALRPASLSPPLRSHTCYPLDTLLPLHMSSHLTVCSPSLFPSTVTWTYVCTRSV